MIRNKTLGQCVLLQKKQHKTKHPQVDSNVKAMAKKYVCGMIHRMVLLYDATESDESENARERPKKKTKI